MLVQRQVEGRRAPLAKMTPFSMGQFALRKAVTLAEEPALKLQLVSIRSAGWVPFTVGHCGTNRWLCTAACRLRRTGP